MCLLLLMLHYHSLQLLSVFWFVCCLLSGKFIFGYKTWKRIRTHSGCKKPITFCPVCVCASSGRKPETISIHLTIKTELILNQIARRASMQTYGFVSNGNNDGVTHRKRKSWLRISHKISVHSRPRLNEAQCLPFKTDTHTQTAHTHNLNQRKKASAQSVH